METDWLLSSSMATTPLHEAMQRKPSHTSSYFFSGGWTAMAPNHLRPLFLVAGCMTQTESTTPPSCAHQATTRAAGMPLRVGILCELAQIGSATEILCFDHAWVDSFLEQSMATSEKAVVLSVRG